MKCLAIILPFAGFAAALSGKATTTRYYDGSSGACGCGNGNQMFSWQTGGSGFYTAAGNTPLFGDATWCGSGCGKCYTLSSTGSAPNGQGAGGAAGKSILVMVTNLCPAGGNANWCAASGANQYGYNYHFDIMAQNAVLGDNVIVDFAETACPAAAASDFSQCQCAK